MPPPTKRLKLHSIALASMPLAVPFLLASQTPGEQRIATAREMLKAANFDSATVLLRRVTDSQAVSSTNEQVQAWVLLGIVAYYRGTDSATTADAFRHVFALAPEAQAQLPDPALQKLFDGLRPLRGGVLATAALASALTEALLRCGVEQARAAGFNDVRYASDRVRVAALRRRFYARRHPARHETNFDRLLMTVVRKETTSVPELRVEASSIADWSLVFESRGVEQTIAPHDVRVVADSIHTHCSPLPD